MPSDRERLDAAIALIEKPEQRLALALAPLRGVVRVLVTGAHPDDEMSTMLAALVRRDGVRVAYACATRGEGGQNAIGPESGVMLGALRTREMEEAARRLGIAVHWLSEGPGESIVDFGFAKTAEASFAHWGRERVVARLVAIIRAEKPDIVWPTFLDVPGQHGHHRAITQATIEAVRHAAPWHATKLYLPAWSGGGDTYDDAQPPPNASVVYDASGVDAASGLTYAQLGECARSAHASQGMGHWVAPGPALYPLHRLDRGVSETTIFDGSPRTLGDLAAQAQGDAGTALLAAQTAIDQALAAWPDRPLIEAAIVRADAQLVRAQASLTPANLAKFGHRLDAKRGEIARVLAELRGAAPVMTAAEDRALSVRLEPDAAIVNSRANRRTTIDASIEGTHDTRVTLALDTPSGWRVTGLPATLDLSPGATQRAAFDLIVPDGTEPALHELALRVDGQAAATIHRAHHPHVGTISVAAPTVLRVRMLDAALPTGARIAYVGGGSDRVDMWLARLGLDVTPLEMPSLAGADLARFTTLVVGIAALRTRSDLVADLPRVHDWVRAGGHLVTLYHRPSDGWDAHSSALAPLAIGAPSLRWRVCDPAAPVTVLAPAHPLLVGPNRIGPADWVGWHKERGLYFAAHWDPAYVPLLAMNDPEEEPLTGALLSGRFGKGRHTHTSLALHHQLEQLVPGALRLIANLVQPAGI